MVSLWPWSGDKNSADSFERTLSGLAQKITRTSAKNDRLRQRSRKLKVSWTIYGGFTYILALLIFVLVTGWEQWGSFEYSTISAGPVLLWGVRRLLSMWYDYRISNTQQYLDSLNKERDATIEKLKAATKYDSTQQLIDKYSSKPTSPKQTSNAKGKKQSQGVGQQQPPQRVFTQPPPTANIPRGPPPAIQQPPLQTLPQASPPSPGPSRAGTDAPGADFAPNAFEDTAPSAPAAYGESSWYDRILDALLGEDETSAKNRFALICSSCRLVNGQAPPGARTLEDVGRWRCSGCGTMNGKESEATKLVQQVAASGIKVDEIVPGEEFAPDDSAEPASEGDTAGEKDQVDAPDITDSSSPASARSRTKGTVKKQKK